jgi:alpha-amylase
MKSKGIAATVFTLGILLAQPSFADISLSHLYSPRITGSLSDESIYFIMTDRFENGDDGNDNGGNSVGRYATGFVPDEIGWWHGGDFKGITKRISYIKEMGFTSIWITPPVKQIVFQGNSSSYHGYWGLDFLRVDPHLGTELDFKEMVQAAHKAGLKVIVDVVANHTADVISYPNNATEYLESYSYPYRTSTSKIFDPSKFAGKKNFPKLSSAKSFAYKPIVPADNAKIKNPRWLNDLTNYHNRGDSDFTGESVTQGDFFGLDDIFTEKPEVVRGWIDVWSYWIEEFDIDGFRIDTFKHINPEFWNVVIPKVQDVARKKGKTDFIIFGEVADADAFSLASYVRSKQTPSVLDFAFQKQVANFARFGGSGQQLVSLFNSDDLYTTATSNAYQLATFLGNHDMGRIGMQLSKAVATDQPQQLLERAKLSNALLFLLRGSPVLYYGDEVGMTGSGGDKEARQDMFPTQVLEWKSETRIGASPIENRSSFDETNELRLQIAALQQIIRDNPALRNGIQQTQFAQQGLFAVTRYAGDKEYFIAFNGSDQDKSVPISATLQNTRWNNLSGKCALTSESAIEIKARSYCVLQSQIPYVSYENPRIKINPVSETPTTGNLLQLSAQVSGKDYVEVSFQVRTPGGTWKLAGTSDHRTFGDNSTKDGLHRVFVEPLNYKSGTKLQVIAVAKGSGGKISQSNIVKFTAKY